MLRGSSRQYVICAVLVSTGLGVMSCGRTPDESSRMKMVGERNEELLNYTRTGDIQGIERCLDAGADANYNPLTAPAPPAWLWETTHSEFGETPLINAARYGDPVPVRLLLRRGALPNVRTIDETPLHAAAVRGHDDVVWLLLQAGANVNARLGLFVTEDAMGAAAARGHATVVFFLYLNGGRVEPVDLCAAVGREYPELVRQYLAIGLKPGARECSGLSAVERARRLPPSSKRDAILRMLTSPAGGEIRRP
jgi:hypothetical protein